MRFEYFVYPEAIEKIVSSGIAIRVEELAKSEDGIPYFGFVTTGELVSNIEYMKKRGYFKTLKSVPEKEGLTFKDSINSLFNNKNGKWKTHRNSGILEEELDTEDFLLLTGILSSHVLGPDEIWDHKKFGFSSISEFTGTVGAYILNRSHGDLKRGYEWETTWPDGRILHNKVSGDHNLDLRIHQVDVTAYKTFDPLGNEVFYRPSFGVDRNGVSGYHSTEASLLVSLIKWAEQNEIPSEMLEDSASKLLIFATSLGQKVGNAAECITGRDMNFFSLFVSFSDTIPALDENYSTKQYTFDRVMTTSEGTYGIYIDPNKNLIFSYEGGSSKIKPKKRIQASFLPSEVDHLLKGLFYQSSEGLGRTSVRELSSVLGYRYSEQFELDMARFIGRNKS